MSLKKARQTKNLGIEQQQPRLEVQLRMHLVNSLKLAKVLLFLMLSFALHQAWADRPLDADGKPLPPNMAALIGKKFKALPIDPKLGDKSPVLPEIDGWRFVSGIGLNYKKITDHRLKLAWSRGSYKRFLLGMSTPEAPKLIVGNIFCVRLNNFAIIKGNQVALALLFLCDDEGFEILDVIPIPKNYGVISAIQILPKNSPPNEFQRLKKIGLIKNSIIVLLPDKYFNVNYCPYYQQNVIDVASNNAKAYSIDLSINKFKRDFDPMIKAFNPNEFCGVLQ